MKRNVFRVAVAVGAIIGTVLSTGASTGVASAAYENFGPTGAEYVSMGDSFIGNGSVGQAFTPTGQFKCNANDNVGHLTAKLMPGVSFADWACGGAVTDDIADADSTKGPQLPGLSENTKYVSVSIGGNDEDFFLDIVLNCLVGIACTKSFQQETFAKLDRLAPRLDRVYSAIRRNAPNAHVVVLGTLRVLPDDARGCFVQFTTGQSNVDFANRAQRRLNEVMGEAADRHGFTAVNLWSDSDRSMCAAPGHRYLSLTGIGPGDHGIPVHPTIAGRKYTAGLIAKAFKAAS